MTYINSVSDKSCEIRHGNKTSKGQVSSELLIVVAIILVLFIPLIVGFYLKISEVNESISEVQAQLVASRIASLANSIGNLGSSSGVITDIYLPPSIEELNVASLGSGSEVVIRARVRGGVSELVEIIKFPVEKTINIENPREGMIRLEISSEKGVVKINKV
ncbi:TPA: hypothetical protein HA238_01055 [Candidatus Micrarchaeota archaeon]|nr:hypothetical protein [Candidatus Micrarchaeota archaeon]